MSETYTVSLNSIIDEFALEKIFTPDNIDSIVIEKKEVNRPGLQLTGFFDHFDPLRIQSRVSLSFESLTTKKT